MGARPMTPKWDLDALLKAVGALHGDAQVRALQPLLPALVKQQTYTTFHHAETRRRLGVPLAGGGGDELMPPPVLAEPELGALHDADSDHWAREAHYAALVAGMHATVTTFSQIVYYALALNRNFDTLLPAHDITIETVRTRMPAGNVKEAVNRMVVECDLRYLAALVALARHHTIVATRVAPIGEGMQAFEVRFTACEHGGERFPARAAEPFVHSTFQRLGGRLVAVGNVLNHHVRSQVRG